MLQGSGTSEGHVHRDTELHPLLPHPPITAPISKLYLPKTVKTGGLQKVISQALIVITKVTLEPRSAPGLQTQSFLLFNFVTF